MPRAAGFIRKNRIALCAQKLYDGAINSWEDPMGKFDNKLLLSDYDNTLHFTAVSYTHLTLPTTPYV